MEPTPKKLLGQACTELCQSMRDAIRLKHYSIRTEQAYVNRIKRDITFHNVPHPGPKLTAADQSSTQLTEINGKPRE